MTPQPTAAAPDAAVFHASGERHRPRFHLTPESTWMNDPNGLIRHDGRWHAFYQNNPFGSAWGNLSWGHAVSDDLVTWEHLPVALPCSEGEMIFSGSVVHDAENSSGLGRDGDGPLIAIYTSAYTDAHPHRAGAQAQSIAVSVDGGTEWTFHEANPVLDRGSQDFRDPKVLWHSETGRWVMVTVEAADQEVHLFASDDLLRWEQISVFTHPALADCLWECPDLVRVPVRADDGEAVGHAWVLVISTNPGGPAGGSGTFAIIGDFDGTTFTAHTGPDPLDLGPDCYAAVSFSGVEGEPVLLGWMNNWAYADRTPTSPWRSTMTLPRQLHLERTGHGDAAQLGFRQRLVVPETLRTIDLDDLCAIGTPGAADGVGAGGTGAAPATVAAGEPFRVRGALSTTQPESVAVRFGEGPEARELLVSVGGSGRIVLDRSRADEVPFAPGHSRSAPYDAGTDRTVSFELVIDGCCAELVLDDGRAIVSELVFPPDGPVRVEKRRSA